MRKTTRVISFVLAAVLVLSFLTACGDKETEEATAEATTAATAVASEQPADGEKMEPPDGDFDPDEAGPMPSGEMDGTPPDGDRGGEEPKAMPSDGEFEGTPPDRENGTDDE